MSVSLSQDVQKSRGKKSRIPVMQDYLCLVLTHPSGGKSMLIIPADNTLDKMSYIRVKKHTSYI